MATIIEKIQESERNNALFFSFEYFPPRTESGKNNLFARIDRMARLKPLFVDVTWSAGGANVNKSDPLDNITLSIVKEVQDYCCVTTCMHLTCNTSTKEEVRAILNKCKADGIRNIMALRGDPPRLLPADWNERERDFTYAKDLVRFIRQEYGEYFCIAVAGYPYGHPDQGVNVQVNFQHLKEKIDAGADFIVSQLFFDADHFLNWVALCREYGINCPILPGIFPLQTWRSLRTITAMSSVPLPKALLNQVEKFMDNDEALRAFGVEYAADMCRQLIDGGVSGLHFYTLNQESVCGAVIKSLELTPSTPSPMPWRRSAGQGRDKEAVRPIYWSNRVKSYIKRTEDWNEFPNDRWGDSSSPSFGNLHDHHLFMHHAPDNKLLLKEWGEELKDLSDVGNVFVNFLGGKIGNFPWSDEPGTALETDQISWQLKKINKMGYWTINSQPKVNGVKSTDRVSGWGKPGGVVYQKAYLEFFTTPQLFDVIKRRMKQFGSRFDYQTAAHEGPFQTTLLRPTAVTWGVFPGSEVVQPTVVDPESFVVWREEAFLIWLVRWGGIYQKDSTSYKAVQEAHDNLLLVTIVDNNYVKGNIFDIFGLEEAEEVNVVEDVIPKGILPEKSNYFLPQQATSKNSKEVIVEEVEEVLPQQGTGMDSEGVSGIFGFSNAATCAVGLIALAAMVIASFSLRNTHST